MLFTALESRHLLQKSFRGLRLHCSPIPRGRPQSRGGLHLSQGQVRRVPPEHDVQRSRGAHARALAKLVDQEEEGEERDSQQGLGRSWVRLGRH